MARHGSCFPKSRSQPRVDDRRVLSGIIFINRNGLRWRGAPKEYGPHKMLCNRWKRWSDKGVFARIMVGLAAEHGEEKTVMINATYLEAYRTAPSMGAKRGRGRMIGRTKGGMDDQPHGCISLLLARSVTCFCTSSDFGVSEDCNRDRQSSAWSGPGSVIKDPQTAGAAIRPSSRSATGPKNHG